MWSSVGKVDRVERAPAAALRADCACEAAPMPQGPRALDVWLSLPAMRPPRSGSVSAGTRA